MKKTLRTTILAVAAMLFNVGYAQTTFDFDNQYATIFPTITGTSSGTGAATTHDGDFTETTTSAAIDGITLTVTPADGSNANRIWNKNPRLRMYGGTMTIASTSGNITKIEFTTGKFASANTVNTGTLSAPDSKVVTWTGDASTVVLTVAANTQLNQMVVTKGGETPTPTPTPTPTINEATNIAAFNALDNGTTATLTLNNAQVLYTWTSNSAKANTQTFVRDASGATMFFNTGLDLKQNDIINGTVVLSRSEYNGTIEAVKTDATSADKLTITPGSAAEPKAVSVAEASNYVSDLVTLSNVTITSEGQDKSTKYYAVVGDDKIQIYDGFHLGKTIETGEGKIVTGIIEKYTNSKTGVTTYEICPIKDITTGINGVKAAASDNAPAYNAAGQRTGTSYKGLVIKNGKKYMMK